MRPRRARARARERERAEIAIAIEIALAAHLAHTRLPVDRSDLATSCMPSAPAKRRQACEASPQ